MNELPLAIAHHLLAFSLAAILAAEIAAANTRLTGSALLKLQRLDRWYGAVAGLVLVVGVLRVLYGEKGPGFYTDNPFFWAKMAAFGGVALLSLPPTFKMIGWSRRTRSDATFSVPDAEVRTLRRWFAGELVLVRADPGPCGCYGARDWALRHEMKATIYHNPKCGTSRKTLEILQGEGVDLTIREYLVDPPTREELRRLYGRAGIRPREGLRAKEPLAQELGLTHEEVDDEAIIDAMARHPILIDRPLVETEKGVRLCRPQERVREIL